MTERTPVIAGNWKMNPLPEGVLTLAEPLRTSLGEVTGVERVLCPPFIYLASIRDLLAGSSIGLGAQDAYWKDTGAYTGEVSAAMLVGLVQYVILGHSERRTYFGETDETVRLKVQAALGHGLRPIVCVGETLEQRDAGQTGEVLRREVQEGLGGLDLPENLIVAYEPIWAIGTGRAATAAIAEETCGQIRLLLGEEHGPGLARGVRILYGGSVTSANVAEFLAEPDIDGALVGGASLKADEFAALARQAAQ
ncbi:MAG: triose-phosphate isomerase [Dehalococcoidia bacterium]